MQSISISTWIRKLTPTADAPIVFLDGSYSLKEAPNQVISGKTKAGIGCLSTWHDCASTNADAFTVGSWHHIAWTRDVNGIQTIYIDGKLVLSSSCDSGVLPSCPTLYRTIGASRCWDDQTYDYFNGDIDDVLIYERVLSKSEIQQLYGSTKLPTVTTAEVSAVTSDSATLNGTVNPNYSTTTVVFEWGTDDNYGNEITATQSPLTGTTDQAVSADISGLASGTTYHFRVKADNSAGTTYGSDQTFTTVSAPPVTAPTATTGAASAVTSTSATLNGIVNPNGSVTTYYFEYGTTTDYGTTTSSKSAGSGSSDVGANTSITGLSPETTCHYRVVAVNSAGTSLGADESFVTSSLTPTLTIGSGSVKKENKITLPITLINIPGTDIAAVSVDIGYDSTLFKNPKASIGPAGSAVEKTVGTSEIVSGLFRISIFSLSNNTAIGDGVVAYLTLDVEKDAANVETVLTNIPSAADPEGYPVAIEGVDGLVNITEYGTCQ